MEYKKYYKYFKANKPKFFKMYLVKNLCLCEKIKKEICYNPNCNNYKFKLNLFYYNPLLKKTIVVKEYKHPDIPLYDDILELADICKSKLHLVGRAKDKEF